MPPDIDTKKMTNERYGGLDFLRGMLITLMIFYHAALIFSVERNWRTHSPITNQLFDDIAYGISLFRLSAFFIVAGFFTAMSTERKGTAYLKDRLLRLGVPMVFCGLFINVPIDYFVFGSSFFSSWKDLIRYILKGEWLGHLWFLGNLLAYTVAYVCCNKLLSIKSKQRLMYYLTNNIHFTVLLIFIIHVAFRGGSSIIGHLVGWQFFSKCLFFSPVSLFLFFVPYIVGLFLYFIRNKASINRILHSRHFIVVFILVLCLSVLINHVNILPHDVMSVYTATIGLLLSLLLVKWVLLIHLKSKLLRYWSESTYTVYLIHQPLLILLYHKIDFSSLGLFFQYMLIVMLVLITSFGFHFGLVRNSKMLTFFLSGKL